MLHETQNRQACVRETLAQDCTAFAVREGYQRLVDGGNMIKKMEWDDVRGWLSRGGTPIGTARRSRYGRSSKIQACHAEATKGLLNGPQSAIW